MERRIRKAEVGDLSDIVYADFLGREIVSEKIRRGEILVCREDRQITGVLRYSWFLDYLPIINFLWVEEGVRNEGRASRLICRLEHETERSNYGMILAATWSDQRDQNFYRKVGFRDIGGVAFRGEPTELILVKDLLEEEEAG